MGYKYETQYDSPNFTPGRQSLDEIIIHWWDDPAKGPTYEGTIATLINPTRGASAHYVATGTGRRVACLVNPEDTAWHAGTSNPATNPNPHSIGIECDPRCRDEDYDVVAELVADIRSAYGNLPLKRHSDFVATRCPGNWDLARIDAIAKNKVSHDMWGTVTDKPKPPVVTPPVVTPPVVTPPVVPVVPETPVIKPVVTTSNSNPSTDENVNVAKCDVTDKTAKINWGDIIKQFIAQFVIALKSLLGKK